MYQKCLDKVRNWLAILTEGPRKRRQLQWEFTAEATRKLMDEDAHIKRLLSFPAYCEHHGIATNGGPGGGAGYVSPGGGGCSSPPQAGGGKWPEGLSPDPAKHRRQEIRVPIPTDVLMSGGEVLLPPELLNKTVDWPCVVRVEASPELVEGELIFRLDGSERVDCVRPGDCVPRRAQVDAYSAATKAGVFGGFTKGGFTGVAIGAGGSGGSNRPKEWDFTGPCPWWAAWEEGV